MPRPRNVNPRVSLHIWIDEALKNRLELLMWSELLNRIPAGSWGAFLEQAAKEKLDWKVLELSPWGFPEGYFIKGPPAMVEALERKLTHG